MSAARPSRIGVDLSSANGLPDWQQVASHGVAFAYVKRSQGAHYLNPTYDQNRVGAVSHRVMFGAYHFAEAHLGQPIAEADHFLTGLHAEPWHLLPCLDLEETGSEGASPAQLEAFAVAFGQAVCRSLGIARLVLYTDRNMLASRIRVTPRLQARYLLWLADLSPSGPHVPAGWRCVIQQYGWHGHVPGIAGEVDLDRALAPLEHLRIAENAR